VIVVRVSGFAFIFYLLFAICYFLFSICYSRFFIICHLSFSFLFVIFHPIRFARSWSICLNDPAMTNDKWKMTNGKSQIENRKYQIENSKFAVSSPKVSQSSQPLAYLFTLFIGHCARRLRRMVFDCIRLPDRVLSHVSRSEDFFQHPAVHIRRDLDAE